MSLFHTLLFLFVSSAKLCISTNTLTNNDILQSPHLLISQNGTYKLGFFTPPNTLNQYLGIWFNHPSVIKLVWVANTNNPITDSSGILTVSNNGQLQLLNGQNKPIWSSQTANSTDKNSTAVLMDTGNFVLIHGGTEIVWESFGHPTDTFLPGMLPTVGKKPSKQNVILRSWKSYADPAEGNFSFGIDTTSFPQLVTWNTNGLPYWRSGPWAGSHFIGIPNDGNTLSNGLVLDENAENGMYVLSFAPIDQYLSLNYEIEHNGSVIGQYWDDSRKKWIVGWSVPSTECDVYNTCGAFGVCRSGESPSCRCLQGFRPKNQNEWKRGNWSGGCERKTGFQCGAKQDGFLKMQMMKVPDKTKKRSAIDPDSCKSQCVNNCSCLAYSYHNTVGCMVWSNELIDIQEFSSGGVDLFIRLANSDLEGGKGHKKTAIVASTVIIGTTLVVVFVCLFLFKSIIDKRGKRMERLTNLNVGDNVGQEPPLYTFDMLRNATDNFHPSNKLGEGGFGPVYKGIVGNGQEIAVKRLSQVSGQGQEEFMNEVVVISKLQHRNLVRLLGCCIEAEEKMLIYEYMHNKSLDVFLFDDEKRELLSWEKRFNIIEGISRGLLYLHRDSRLRIIHRDLKTSNILLDEELNAKISDFGMARIFGGNQDQASTRRVVGTYGYMSPEYTMGQFSEKSDVYSFGVILLEIVSGKRNITFHRNEHSTLLAYAWKLWNEESMTSLIDPIIISDSHAQMTQIMRCIQVGLLCVQEHAKDRPNMATVMSMLDSESERLPHPKKPPFSEWEASSDDQRSMTTSSINTCSFSTPQAR